MPTIITKGAMSAQAVGFITGGGNGPTPPSNNNWIFVLDADGLPINTGYANFGVHVSTTGETVFTYVGGNDAIRYNQVSNTGSMIWQKEIELAINVSGDLKGNRTVYDSSNSFIAPFVSSGTSDGITYTIYTAPNSTPTSTGFANNFILTKVDSSGNTVWQTGVNQYVTLIDPAPYYNYANYQEIRSAASNGSHVYSLGYFYEYGQTVNYQIQGMVIHKYDPIGGAFTSSNGYVGNYYYDSGSPTQVAIVDEIFGIKGAVDTDGTLYVAGVLYNLNGLTWPGVSGLANSGDDAYFIAKFDTTGSNLLWLKLVSYNPGPSTVFSTVGVTDIKLDASGNILLTGAYFTDTFPADTNSFVAKFDATGTLLFSKNISIPNTNGPQVAPFVTTDLANNIYFVFVDADLDLQIHCYDQLGAYIWSNKITATNYPFFEPRDFKCGGPNENLYLNVGCFNYDQSLLLCLPKDGSGQGTYDINGLFDLTYATFANNIANGTVTVSPYSTVTNRNTVPTIEGNAIVTNEVTGSATENTTSLTSNTIPI